MDFENINLEPISLNNNQSNVQKDNEENDDSDGKMSSTHEQFR